MSTSTNCSDSPFKLHRKVRAEFGCGGLGLVMPVKRDVTIRIAQPDFLRTARKAELHFAHDLNTTVRSISDFHADLGCDGHAGSSTVRFEPFIRHPDHIRHLDAIGGLDRAGRNRPSIVHEPSKDNANVCLKRTAPVGGGTHDDLIEAVGFNLERQVAQRPVFTDVLPGKHTARMPFMPVVLNKQFSLS